MIRYYFQLISILVLFFSCSSVYALSSTGIVGNFYDVEKFVMKIKDKDATLIVMDDDDTLTMMKCTNELSKDTCQYLGGPAWYEWQSGLIGTTSPDRVADTEDELLKISTLLFAMNKMEYTEDDLGKVLYNLTKKGVRLLVETARGGNNLSATKMQMDNLKVQGSPYKSFLEMISKNSLVMGEMGIASLPGPFLPCNITTARVVNYEEGIMYVSGQNKGLMLKCLLNYYNKYRSSNSGLPVKNIVFIDDTKKNVEDVYTAFKDSKLNVLALHYNALDNHKALLTSKGEVGKRLRNIATKRFEAIKSTLSSQLLSPVIKTK